MTRFLFLLMLATFFKHSLQQGQGCQTVEISGSTTLQTALMTTYTMTGQTFNDRPVYQSSRGYYLHYQSSDTTWNVGLRLGSDSVGMYVTDNSTYADGITGTWYLAGSSSFLSRSSVTVTCYVETSLGSSNLGSSVSVETVRLSYVNVGAIVGAVVGALCCLVFIVRCVYFCKKSVSTSVSPTPRHTSMNTSAYTPPPDYPGPPREPAQAWQGGQPVVVYHA